MSDVGEDDAVQSDWIREENDDSDSENGGSLQRKYYSEYSPGGEVPESDTAEPVQWTGSESDLKKHDSPIISNMEDYHAGPEFEEKCSNWMTGEYGAEVGPHRSSSEIDHNENHLINADYRGGESFCDSDILSSDQSLSDYEPNENRWSSSESSRKNDGGQRKIIQEQTECSMPRASVPVFSRSDETARAKLDQKQSVQRPDRCYARRQSVRRRSVPGEHGIGQQMSCNNKSSCPIKIKCSKSCTTECEILKPGSETNYPLPDRARFSSLYEEILRCDEFLFFTDEDDNGDDGYSDFGDDGPVSEITGLDTSDSKSESSRNRVSASRTSARTESPEGSLRDGAVPGGKDNSVSVVELSPLRIEEPFLSPILPVLRRKSQVSHPHDERKSRNSNDVTETKVPLMSQTTEKSIGPTIKQEASIVFDQTLGEIPSLHEKVVDIKKSKKEAACSNACSRLATIQLMSSLENTSASNILGTMLENAYLQTVKVFESTESLSDCEMKGSVHQHLTDVPGHNEALKATDVPPKNSDEKKFLDIDECINTTCNNKHDDGEECKQDSLNEKTCSDNTSVDSMATKLGSAENINIATKSNGPEGEEKMTPVDSAVLVQGENVPISTSPKDNQVEVCGADSNDIKTEPLAPCIETDSAVRNPITPVSRQYYMPFLNVLRSRKLINKKVRRPPQKFFKLLQAKSETLKVPEKCSSAEFREASLIRDLSRMSTKIFPKGREVPPGWKPGQYSTGPSTNAAACNETASKRKHKKAITNKCKQHNKCYNNNKKRQVSSEASVQEVESEESITARNLRASYSSESSESTDSKHTVGYGERYNPHSEDSSEMENKGKKTFGQEFESKRQYYERLNSTRKKALNGGMMDKREITSQVNFLKTIDEFCTAEDMVNMEYDYSEEFNQPSDQSIDSVEYHISLAQYYSGRPSNLQILKGNPPSEPMASGSSGVRIRRAKTNIPSALDAERLKSLNVDEASKDGQSKLGMWSLNTLYAHKMSISEVPRESNLKSFAPSGDGKDEAADANQPVVHKTKTKHSRKRQIDRHKDHKLGKYRSVKTSHLEKLAVFESERKVTYLDLLKSGYNSKPYKTSKENIDTQSSTKEIVSVQKSKSCDAPGNKCFYTQSQKEVSPLVEPDCSKRLKLVRFNDPKPLEDDKTADVLDRSEEDTWCYSVNAMLLRANQALEQQKVASAETNHHFPRPESAKVVAPVVKHMSSSFLSELLEQDKVEQKMVKQTQKMRRNEAPKASDDERQGKRNVNNNDNTEENKQMHSFPVALSSLNDAKPSCALSNVLPSIEQINNDANVSAMHSAGILKIKTSKKPKDKQPWRDQKVFPADCPANVYFSTASTQPSLPPRKLLPLRYAAPVDVASQIGANVRIMKESLLQRAANDNLEAKSQAHADKQILAKATTANAVTFPRYSRTDHRVSTIVQMFSDFNTNASAASDVEDDEVDTQTSIDEIHTPYVQPPRDGNRIMIGPSRNLLDVRGKTGFAKLFSTLSHVPSNYDGEEEPASSIGSEDGNSPKYNSVLNFTSGCDSCQFDNDKPFDESAINSSNLKCDVSNDPGTLGLKSVMDILGQKQESLLVASPNSSSQRTDLCIENQSYPIHNNVNIKGVDRMTFLNAALSASNDIPVTRNIVKNDEIFEYCQVDRNNAQSQIYQQLFSLNSCHGLWDPNFTQENVKGEQLLVHNQGKTRYIPDGTTKCSKDGQAVDSDKLPEHKNDDMLLNTDDKSHVDTCITSYPERHKKSESTKSLVLVDKLATQKDGSPIITSSCFGVHEYACWGRNKKLHHSLTKQYLSNDVPQQSMSNANVSDSNDQWMSSEIIEQLSVSSQDQKSDNEWHRENKGGLCTNTMTVTEKMQRMLSNRNFDWGKFKVPPPYPDRGDDFHGDERDVVLSRQSGYSTPTESSRQNMTDSEFSLAFAKMCEEQTMVHAPNTQDSHTIETIDGPQMERMQCDSAIKNGESGQELSTASQFTDLAGDDMVVPLNEKPANLRCPENITVADQTSILDISEQVTNAGPIRESIQVRERKKRTNALGNIALTVVNSSCLVYKRLSANQNLHCTELPRYKSLNINSLKLMRSCDLLQTVAHSKQRLWQCLQFLVREVTFFPAFQIRSLHPPEMIPIVIPIYMCGSESMGEHGLYEPTETVPVFYFRDGSSILESIFTVYRLASGLYGINSTDLDRPKQKIPHIAESLIIGKLTLYRAGSEVDLNKTRDVYLLGDEVSTYEEALKRITDIYDKAKFEKDAGVYFKMTCGWVPSQISMDGRVMKTICYCYNCIMMNKAMNKKEVESDDANFKQEFRMYHNYCDICGGCVATLPALNKTKCKVELNCKGWTVDDKGFAIPLNTKPVSKKKILPALTLPKLMSRKRFTSRNEMRDKKSLENRCKSFSLPYVDSNATLSPRPTQSASSPNMYIDNWWWKEMEQIRQEELEGFRRGNGTGETHSEIELAEYNEEVRYRQKQRLQEIKEEMRMHRLSPASEQMELLYREWSTPPPVEDESAATQEPLPDDTTTDTHLYNDDKTSASSSKRAKGDDSVSHTHASAQTSSDVLTKKSDKGFSYYFRNLNSQRKASWVKNYVEPPTQPTLPNNYLNNRAPKLINQRIPSKLPPVYKDTNLGPLTNKLSKKAQYLTSKMRNVQKRKSKKKPKKSSSLSSADSSRDSMNSGSSSSLSCSDSLEGADFFENHKRKGWPTSIEDIFTRTLPLLRKNLGNSSTQDARKLKALRSNFMEGDDDLIKYRAEQQRQCSGPSEQGDVADSLSGHSDVSSTMDYDMCDDADEMRQMWKLCFPEVNFWDRKRRSKRSRKKTTVATHG